MNVQKKPIATACAPGIEVGQQRHFLGRFNAPELMMKTWRRLPVLVYGVTGDANEPTYFSQAVDDLSGTHIAVFPWLTYRRAYVFHKMHVAGDLCPTLTGYAEPAFLEARGQPGLDFLEHGRVWDRLIIEPVRASDFRAYVRGLAGPADELEETGAFVAHLRDLESTNQLPHEISTQVFDRAEFARQFPEYPNAARLVFDEYALTKRSRAK